MKVSSGRMRYLASIIVLLFFLSSAETAEAQQEVQRFEVEVEPVAYILNGAGVTGAYQRGRWNYSIEVFGLEIPESLHGDERFGVSTLGAELQAERFFGAPEAGFFAGPEIGVSNLEVTHQASSTRESRMQYSVGLRGGYRWYTGLGDLYLSPVAGLVYTLNSEAIEVEGESFESGSLTPFATVGIGWSF